MTPGNTWKGQSRGGKTGYCIFAWVLRHLGLGAAYTLLAFVVVYFIPFAPKGTSAAWRYSRKILNKNILQSTTFLFRSYFAFGKCIIDKFAINAGMTDSYEFEFESLEAFLDAFNAGKGLISIGAHFGNWAAGAPFFRKYGVIPNIVMYDNEHQEIKKVLEENKVSGHEYNIIPVRPDSLDHVFGIMQALDRGELVSFQGDRYINSDKLIDREFMGHEAKFPAGPFLLASRMKSPVFFYLAIRMPGRKYRFVFCEADKAKDIISQYVALLENYLGQYPEQWYNYYDFWGLKETR